MKSQQLLPRTKCYMTNLLSVDLYYPGNINLGGVGFCDLPASASASHPLCVYYFLSWQR